MPKREDKLLLIDILQSGDKIAVYTKSIAFAEFVKNDMMIDAVVRNLEIIGEASDGIEAIEKVKKEPAGVYHADVPEFFFATRHDKRLQFLYGQMPFLVNLQHYASGARWLL